MFESFKVYYLHIYPNPQYTQSVVHSNSGKIDLSRSLAKNIKGNCVNFYMVNFIQIRKVTV